MVRQNTKYTRKKRLTKKQKLDIANKLERTVNNVSKKGLFFKTKNKFGDWSIVDGRTKKVLLDNILLVESANIILRTITTANVKQLQNHHRYYIILCHRSKSRHIFNEITPL